ncbi:hypothetical protein ABBQ38_011625 [Trebouxia sp. C0009 RCD-2024]
MMHASPCTLHTRTCCVQQRSGSVTRGDLQRRAKRCRGHDALSQGLSKPRRSGSQCNRPSIVVLAAQRRPPSFIQRWRTLKAAVDKQNNRTRQAISSLPPARAIAHALAVVRRWLEPLYRVSRLIQAWWDAQLDSYAEFGGEEVKRQWEWKRRTEAERSLWHDIITFIKVSFLTVFYMGVVPVSVFWGAFLPLLAAWACYDRPLLSPVFIMFIPMMLLKFPLGYPVKLL